MDILSTFIAKDPRVEVIYPVGDTNQNSFDCFSIPLVDEWANRNKDPNKTMYKPWANIEKEVYFSIKTRPTKRAIDVPVGFQINIYCKDPAFKKHISSVLNKPISDILGVDAHVEKVKCIYWEVKHGKDEWGIILDKIISKTINIISTEITQKLEGDC